MTTLELNGLGVTGPGGRAILDDIGFSVAGGEIVGLVGESGSGKSMTSLALTGLLPRAMTPRAGTATLAGKAFLAGGRTTERPDISIVFQNARAALNPTMKIGRQLERLLKSRSVRSGRRSRAREMLVSVGIPDTDRVLGAYPHQLSGGMNQRVMIALAIAAEPSLLIADEPTTGLDVTVQAQILDLFLHTTADSGRGMLFITHDLGVVAQMCDRVVVMNQGKVVETGPVRQIFHNPAEAYTTELIASATAEAGRKARKVEVTR